MRFEFSLMKGEKVSFELGFLIIYIIRNETNHYPFEGLGLCMCSRRFSCQLRC